MAQNKCRTDLTARIKNASQITGTNVMQNRFDGTNVVSK